MSDLLMIEAALFHLRSSIGDDPEMMPVRLAADILSGAVQNAKAGGLNPARVHDIEFALNDLVAAVEDTGAPEHVSTAVEMLRRDAASLHEAGELPPELIASIGDFQRKLRERGTAIEKSQYRIEGSPEPVLPHPPEELRDAAIPIVRHLAGLGFDTPALDTLIADAESLRFHSINDILNELDVVVR